MAEKTLLETVTENAVFVAEFAGIVIVMVAVAYVMEKMAKRRAGSRERILSTRKVAVCGMFSAIAAVLMVIEVPVPFAPPFYGLDLSELPVLIGTFAFGPVAGVLIEFCKIVLKIIFKPTTTAFVGELANFVIGCSFLLPASAVYLLHKTRKNAVIAVTAGTLSMTVFGTAQVCPAVWHAFGTDCSYGDTDQRVHWQYYDFCHFCGCSAEFVKGRTCFCHYDVPL